MRRPAAARRLVGVALGPLLAVAGCAAAHGSQPRPSNTPTSTAVATTVASTTPGAPGAPMGSEPVVTAAGTIHQWAEANESLITGLGTDLTDFTTQDGRCGTESRQKCYAPLGPTCRAFGQAVESARKVPAAPGATGEILWSTTLTDYGQGAQDCEEAVQTLSASSMEQAVRSFADGRSQLLDLENSADVPQW